MKTISLIFCVLVSISAIAQVDTSMYAHPSIVDLGGSFEKGVNLANSIQQKKIADEQLKQLKLQNEALEKSAETKMPSESSKNYSLKITMRTPNNEEKTFMFNEDKEPQVLNAGFIQTGCVILSPEKDSKNKYFEILCLQKKHSDVMFSTRALCASDLNSSFFYVHEKNSHYALLLECNGF